MVCLMDDLYLIGTGGLAREVLGWMRHEDSPLLPLVKGFLVTSGSDVGSFVHGYPILHLDDLNGEFNFIPTIGNGETRQQLVNALLLKGGKPFSYISASVMLGVGVTVGAGCIINPRSSISSDVTIGDYVLINCNTGVGHDVSIGDFCTLLGSNTINGNVRLESNSLIGSSATIRPGKTIGFGATVGMGAVVFKNVKSGTTVLGNPAKKIS
jgi:sugar O-acyltransferase (sialic acid O-acetyltransferase NeuD family)